MASRTVVVSAVMVEHGICLLTWTHSWGIVRILHWGPQKLSAEGARIEAPRPSGSGLGGGVPLPNRLGGLKVEPRPPR